MTANFSDQGMTGSAKAFRREVQAMRGPFSVALAGPKEGFSELMSEIAERRGDSGRGSFKFHVSSFKFGSWITS